MTTVIFDDVVHTDYGQFDIVWSDDSGFDGDFDKFFAGQINGLAGAASGEGLYLNLARRSGGSPVRIELCDAEPTLEPEWEDVVEVSITVPEDADPRWSTWAGEDGGALAIPPGTHRVRVNARGRDAGRDGEFAEESVDFYLVQIWSAPATPDEILRRTSADADYWHSEIGSRR